VAILRTVISVAIILSVVVSIDRLYHVIKCLAVLTKAKLTGRKPEDAFTPQPLPDPVYEGHLYPKVAVQLPMFNERAVCQAIIDSACEMSWPRHRFKVQVMLFSSQTSCTLWKLALQLEQHVSCPGHLQLYFTLSTSLFGALQTNVHLEHGFFTVAIDATWAACLVHMLSIWLAMCNTWCTCAQFAFPHACPELQSWCDSSHPKHLMHALSFAAFQAPCATGRHRFHVCRAMLSSGSHRACHPYAPALEGPTESGHDTK
jgi:hypothetical protein